MLYLYRSNRLERLADRLAEVLAEPAGGGALAPETVVVQGPGTARWLSARIAARLGVCANVRFPLPAAFIWDCFRAVLPDLPATSAYDPGPLTWRVFGLLDRVRGEPGFAALGHYLEGGDELKRFRLAERLAATFDQYLVYRPDWIRAWEQGGGEDWQAAFWRRLVAEGGPGHWVHVHDAFLETLARPGDTPGYLVLPGRVSVFGLPTLSPSYLDLVARLAERLDVHLFLLDPSREYWSDIESPGVTARRRARWRREGRPDASGYYAVGNPLLASLGRMGRDFLDQVLQYPAHEEDLWEDPLAEHDSWDGHPHPGGPLWEARPAPTAVAAGRRSHPAAGPSLLGLLQRDVLELRDRGREPGAPALAVSAEDRSLQVHACHGPLREVQVLHDALLDLFERLPGLEPRDVLVLAPDPDVYAPAVDAVFGAAPAERHIPWAMGRHDPAAADPAVAVVLQLLDLPASRLPASEVLALLEVPAVARRLGVEEAGVEALRGWVRDAGIRWGADAASRAEADLPAVDATTWAFGLRRLFLGYAMPDAETLFAGVLPCPGPEGSSAEWLGALASLVERLTAWRRRLAGVYPAARWAALLGELVDDFLAPGDEEEEARLLDLREAAAAVAGEAAAAGHGAPFGREVFRERLSAALAGRRGAPPILAGGVTFAGLGQLPAVPARVVWVLGMNGADFPRAHRPPGFDLTVGQPRKGDRSRRDEDRQRFLDALLAAREVFAVSYVGRSARDNSRMVPSVVVSELLDYLEQGFVVGSPPARDGQPTGEAVGGTGRAGPETGPAAPDAMRALVVTEHPLQPFSRRYFDGRDPRLSSYARQWLPVEGEAVSGTLGTGPVSSCRRKPESREIDDLDSGFRRGDDVVEMASEALRAGGDERACVLDLGSFVQAPLPLAADAGREIELSGLERFLENPARHFLRERLGVRLEAGEGALEDAETFQLDRLAAYRLRDEALGAALAEADGERAVLPLAASRGELPLGPAGELTFAREIAEVPALAERLRPALAGALPALEVDLALDGFRLRGWLNGVTPAGLVTYRATKPKARDLLRLWVRHLALCALAPPGVALASRHFGVTGAFTLGPVVDPRSTLQALARAYRDGLAAPLPFFPETSLAWARAARDGKTADACWQKARARWYDDYHRTGEALDPYVAVAFRDWEPPDPAFAAAAEAVLGPLLDAEGEEGADAPA